MVVYRHREVGPVGRVPGLVHIHAAKEDERGREKGGGGVCDGCESGRNDDMDGGE